MAFEQTDRRDPGEKVRVFRYKLAQYTWASGVSAAVSKAMPFNGRVRIVAGVANNSTNAITYTTLIEDEDGIDIYSKADWAENATEVVTLTADTELYIPFNSTIKITPSGDPGATGGTFDITFIGV